MKNPKLWAGAFSQFEALRSHIPPTIDERRVQEYHDLLTQLQVASGEDFTRFRIPPSEMQPRIVSVIRGTRRFPGQTNYSKDKYGSEDFFRRQIDGLRRYISTLSTSSENGKQSVDDKDYWSMSDEELETLANKLHIPPWGRAGKEGEHWFVDRGHIISQLVNRDQALKGEQAVPNVINIGSMEGSVIQQGTKDSSVQIKLESNDAELLRLLTQIRETIDQLGLAESAKEQLSIDIQTTEVQIKAPHPKPGIIAESLHSINIILQSAIGHGIASGLVVEIAKYLTSHHL